MNRFQNKLSIGEFCKVSAGGTPNTSIRNYWEGGQIPWMSSGEIHKKRVRYTDKFITNEGLVNSSAKIFPKNTVLIALAGQGKTRGAIAISEIELSTNQSVSGIISNPSICLPDFLYYNLSNRYQELRSESGGSGRAGLNLSIISNLKINLPPLPEQKQIIDILNSFDKVLNNYREKEKVYKNLIKSIIDELTYGRNSKFYEIKKIGEIVENLRNKTNSNLPIYSVSIHSGMVPRNQLDRSIISELKNEAYLYAAKGDLCYNMMRMWQGASGIAPKDCLVSPAYVVCRPLQIILSEYLGLLCQSSYCINQFKRSSRGLTSDRWRLYFDDFSKIEVPIPPIDKQREIISIVSNQKYLLKKFQEQYQLIKHLKSSVMDDLLSGRKRVNV